MAHSVQVNIYCIFFYFSNLTTFCTIVSQHFLSLAQITSISLCTSTEINECSQNSHNCDGNATCTNTDGSYWCTCNLGFSGNGTSCRGNSIWQGRMNTMQCFSIFYVHAALSGIFLGHQCCFSFLCVIFMSYLKTVSLFLLSKF